jgi:signal transduction histidine kinase
VNVTGFIPYESTTLAVYLLLAVVFFAVFQRERKRYLLLWVVAFLFITVHDGVRLAFHMGYLPPALGSGVRVALLAAAGCVLWGLYDFLALDRTRMWLAAGAPVAAVIAAGMFVPGLRRFAEVAVYWVTSAALMACGLRILESGVAGVGRWVTGLSFMPFAVWIFSYPLVMSQPWFTVFEAEVDLFFVFGVSVGILLMHFEIARDDARKLAEQNRALLEQTLEAQDRERAMQDHLAHAQRMDALGRLAGGIAHDFNNVLTTVIGGTDLALAQLTQTAPAWKDLTQVREAARRAAGLTTQLLAFGRRQVLPQKSVSLNEAVSSSADILRRSLDPRCKLVVNVATPSMMVKAAPAQLDQIVMNLALNARDAMPDGGALTITAEMVDGPTDAGGIDALARLVVSDTGTGIPAELQSRIFEPFFTTKSVGQGTGLGLAIVYGTVRELGGRVEVASRVGAGSSFTVYLPTIAAAQDLAVTQGEPALKRKDLRGTRVLVVEDDSMIQQVVRRALVSHGYDAVVVGTAEEALDTACAQGFEVLLTDIELPGRDGINLAREVRQVRPSIGIVLMSGYTDRQLPDDLGVHSTFLAKPFTMDELVSALGRVVV